jgi:anoctamin-10
MFLELGLPFILRFVNDWRAGKTTIKKAVETVKSIDLKKLHADKGQHTPAVVRDAEEAEKRFMDKVERELGLPDYNLFSGSSFGLPPRPSASILRFPVMIERDIS